MPSLRARRRSRWASSRSWARRRRSATGIRWGWCVIGGLEPAPPPSTYTYTTALPPPASPPALSLAPRRLQSVKNPDKFPRWRAVELKHGRIAMAASTGYIVQEFLRWPGYLSPTAGVKFSELPNGIAAWHQIPMGGIAQFMLFMALMEGITWQYYDIPSRKVGGGKDMFDFVVPAGKSPGDVVRERFARKRHGGPPTPEESLFSAAPRAPLETYLNDVGGGIAHPVLQGGLQVRHQLAEFLGHQNPPERSQRLELTTAWLPPRARSFSSSRVCPVRIKFIT